MYLVTQYNSGIPVARKRAAQGAPHREHREPEFLPPGDLEHPVVPVPTVVPSGEYLV